MRLLFLTCHLPFPPHSGGRRREYELLTRLVPDVDVELIAVSKTPAEDRACAAVLSGLGRVSVFAAQDGGAPRRAPLAPQVARHRSQAASAAVARALADRRVDAVHVEGFYLMQHVPAQPGVPVVLGEQNVEHRLWRLRADTHGDPVARAAEYARARITARAERAAWQRADLCVAVTDEDGRAIVEETPAVDVRVVPDGIDHDSALGDDTPAGTEHLAGDGPRLVMVGNYGYAPNADAARHLLDDVMPAVWSTRPGVRVLLVGNAPGPELRARAAHDPRVVVTGRVASVAPFLQAADLIVCPLRYGGGVKVKMLEALHLGRPIVATPVAVQGLPGAHRSVRVEDGGPELAAAIAQLLADPAARRALGARARRFARDLPTWDEAAGALADCYRAVAGAGTRRRRVA